jgi:hypothetical protein
MPEDVAARACDCDESAPLDEVDDGPEHAIRSVEPMPGHPKACPKCGRVFTPAEDEFQIFCETLYRRADTGEILGLRDAPPGASWDAVWYHDIPEWCGLDGRAVIVKCPDGHDWHVDGKCSNCTRPDDKVHKCWCRHGDPTKAELTVDKNGDTCQAGAGSIQAPHWHGFLTNGVLSERR